MHNMSLSNRWHLTDTWMHISILTSRCSDTRVWRRARARSRQACSGSWRWGCGRAPTCRGWSSTVPSGRSAPGDDARRRPPCWPTNMYSSSHRTHSATCYLLVEQYNGFKNCSSNTRKYIKAETIKINVEYFNIYAAKAYRQDTM